MRSPQCCRIRFILLLAMIPFSREQHFVVRTGFEPVIMDMVSTVDYPPHLTTYPCVYHSATWLYWILLSYLFHHKTQNPKVQKAVVRTGFEPVLREVTYRWWDIYHHPLYCRTTLRLPFRHLTILTNGVLLHQDTRFVITHVRHPITTSLDVDFLSVRSHKGTTP